ncbi:hypothetical protein AGJ34_15425 [Cronobacter dublinensis subsp. dublinensis]|nr:hypothetical protein [Cronobacter dublinensis subsp. dublinensis]EGT5670295.1 hypothetical protein [Cronobacter dublinensis subsp. dublinensis]EGT5674383.1 hypothetical protein [Cronobacter dublinensis subsp. dublinensis]EGT5677930.1 hypothetical protein [Cronobacter dublinensis subsp. dublinensis]EGT5687436.1 hypothetical protein [Cronobacter dublinensis subsp. dublinensis]
MSARSQRRHGAKDDPQHRQKNTCPKAGIKTGLFDNKCGASLNVMSMVFDEAEATSVCGR